MPGIGEGNVCDSCGWELEPAEVLAAADETATAAQSEDANDQLVVLMLFIPSIAVLVQLFYVAWVHAFRFPGHKYLAVLAVTSICVAALGMMDAERLGAGTKGSVMRYHPALWYLMLFVLWPVMLPLYLKKRAVLRRPSYVETASIIAGVFVLSSLAVGMVIRNSSARPAVVLKPGTRLTLRTGKQQGTTGSLTIRAKAPDTNRRAKK